jgi:phosphatidylserine/phosphatidylglycerophosphate/cardiolipin synthase-like enzyme
MVVKIITHRPEDMMGYIEQNKAYHAKLKQDGVALIYNQRAHAKIVIADRAIAVISSMNFYPKASAGGKLGSGNSHNGQKCGGFCNSFVFERI